MSLPKKMMVRCKKCGTEIEVTVFESINTDYAENIAEQISSGDLFNAKCDKCGFVNYLEYDVLYHDIKHGAMIWVLQDDLPEYAERVAQLRNSANILGYKTTRIVNNINELRQKVACLENGRDDKIIELCKVFIVYNLLSKQPDFDFNNAFYTTYSGKERVFLYDKNGQELSCELLDETYLLLYEMFYDSEYISTFEDYYALIDYDWAESALQSIILEQEKEKIDAENTLESITINSETPFEKRSNMSARIDRIYCFDYTKKIGFYDSIRDFAHLEMEYITMAVSTEKVHVNATPTQFKINREGTESIREYAISKMEQLIEISKDLAINSPQYIKICYADDTDKYFKYDGEFCRIFSMATNYKATDDKQTENTESPYVIKQDYSNINSIRYTEPTYAPTPTCHKTAVNESYVVQKKKKKGTPGKIAITILILIVIVIVIGVCASRLYSEDIGSSGTNSSSTVSSNYSDDTLTPISEPESGYIISGSRDYNDSELTIMTSGSESYVVKLKTSSGETRLSFYVRAGDTVTVGVPAECLYIYFASGDTWYGISNLFGDDTSYSMDDEVLDFINYKWEYTLYPVSDGNFSETPINPSEF